MEFTEHQWWFILKFFLPDYLKSSEKNDIGEWLLGKTQEQPKSYEEIDLWFKEWVEQLAKQQDVGWEFIKRKNLKGINRKRKEFYLDMWKDAVTMRENEGGNYIDCYCKLFEELSNGIVATLMKEFRDKQKEPVDEEAEKKKKFTKIKKAIINRIYEA